MAAVLVTGGSGMLGSVLVPRLLDAGHDVRVLSRSEDPDIDDRAAAAQGDLLSGDGLSEALDGIDVVVHAATSPFRRTRSTDVEGTATLLATCTSAGTEHLLYTGIVGVDRHPLPYYKAKWAAEQVIEASDVPWTILRGTQFHTLLDGMLRSVTRFPIVPAGRRFVFQPVDAGEYADAVVEAVGRPPAGRAPDVGGPEVREMRDLARVWLRAKGRRRPTIAVPVPGKVGRAFRAGVHTCPDRAVGTITWEQFLGVAEGDAGSSSV